MTNNIILKIRHILDKLMEVQVQGGRMLSAR